MTSELCSSTVAVIVSYNPELGVLRDGLEAVVRQVAMVVIVDNHSQNSAEVARLAIECGATFHARESNAGVAAALNVGFEVASTGGFDWVLTLDQDSRVPSNFMSEAESVICRDIDSQVAIVCPNFVNGGTLEPGYGGGFGANDVERCITSGSLNRVAVWREVGGFDEDMFIDGVDFDFCARVRRSGQRIVLLPSVMLEHVIGSPSLHRVFGRQFVVFNHSAARKFYIAQNIVYLGGKYRGGRRSLVSYAKLMKQMLLVFFYESDRRAKIASLYHGMRSGERLLARVRWARAAGRGC